MNNYEYIFSQSKGFYRKELSQHKILGNKEISVNILSVGICGSDLFHYTTYTGEELRPGHEWVGRVVEVGNDVKNASVGDFVTSSSTLGCGACQYCLRSQVNFCVKPVHLGSEQIGCLRKNLTLNDFNAVKLESYNESDVLIEVMAVAEEVVNLIRENKHRNYFEQIEETKNILVFGCGTVGILVAYLLKTLNCNVHIVDVIASRTQRARNLDLESKLLPELLLSEKLKNSFDVVIDATSDGESKLKAWNLLPVFSKINSLAIIVGKYKEPISFHPNNFAQLALRISFMRGVPLETVQSTAKKWSGKLGTLRKILITHQFASNEIPQAFSTAINKNISGKVVISFV